MAPRVRTAPPSAVDPKGFNMNTLYRPSPLHLFTNPLYLIRRGLFLAVKKHSHHLRGRLLDFGCGSKPYKDLLEVREYVGVDFENPGHDHSSETIDVYYDGKRLPFLDTSFDSALATEVLEHVFEPDQILRELHRVLKPGGNLLVTLPFVWNEHELPYDAARYTQGGLRHLLERNGFEVVVLEKRGTFWSTLMQLWNVFLAESILPPCAFTRRILWPLACVPANLAAVLLSPILRNQSLYLSNVCVARKPEVGPHG